MHTYAIKNIGRGVANSKLTLLERWKAVTGCYSLEGRDEVTKACDVVLVECNSILPL